MSILYSHSFLNPQIKTMIEAGNIEGAINKLGGKKTDNLIELIKLKKNEELIEIPVPPKHKRTNSITPKVKFVKNKGGTKRKKGRKTRKYKKRI